MQRDVAGFAIGGLRLTKLKLNIIILIAIALIPIRYSFLVAVKGKINFGGWSISPLIYFQRINLAI
jgi:hypothetical protein